MATISRDYVSGVISVAAERALLGDWAATQGIRRWRRKRGSGGDGGTVTGATATAATYIGENSIGAIDGGVGAAVLGSW